MNAKRLPLSPATLILALVGAGMLTLLLRAFLTSTTEREAFVQPVTLTAPPPPPQQEEKKPPDEPPPPPSTLEQNTPNESEGPGAGGTPGPASEGPNLASTGPLGLNEAGGAGGDSFGLAARRGGHELLLTAPPGGGGASPIPRFIEFASLVQAHLESQLNRFEDLRQSCYSVQVKVTVGASGVIDEVKISRSTGDHELDAKIRAALLDLAPMSATPPPGMPWPVGLKILSRRADCAAAAPA
jgi:TonB family protein